MEGHRRVFFPLISRVAPRLLLFSTVIAPLNRKEPIVTARRRIDDLLECFSQDSVAIASRVLITQCGIGRGVSGAMHEFSRGGSSRGGQRESRMAKVMKVEIVSPN